MRKINVVFLMVLMTIAALSTQALAAEDVAVKKNGAEQMGERFAWMSNLAEARLLAKKENKPLLVVFRCEP